MKSQKLKAQKIITTPEAYSDKEKIDEYVRRELACSIIHKMPLDLLNDLFNITKESRPSDFIAYRVADTYTATYNAVGGVGIKEDKDKKKIEKLLYSASDMRMVNDGMADITYDTLEEVMMAITGAAKSGASSITFKYSSKPMMGVSMAAGYRISYNPTTQHYTIYWDKVQTESDPGLQQSKDEITPAPFRVTPDVALRLMVGRSNMIYDTLDEVLLAISGAASCANRGLTAKLRKFSIVCQLEDLGYTVDYDVKTDEYTIYWGDETTQKDDKESIYPKDYMTASVARKIMCMDVPPKLVTMTDIMIDIHRACEQGSGHIRAVISEKHIRELSLLGYFCRILADTPCEYAYYDVVILWSEKIQTCKYSAFRELTAEEAYKVYKKAKKEDCKTLDNVYKHIEYTSLMGRHAAVFGKLDSGVISKLKSMGYEVRESALLGIVFVNWTSPFGSK